MTIKKNNYLIISMGLALIFSCEKIESPTNSILETKNFNKVENQERKALKNPNFSSEILEPIEFGGLVLFNVYLLEEFEQMVDDISDFVNGDDISGNKLHAFDGISGHILVQKKPSETTGRDPVYVVAISSNFIQSELAPCDPETRNCYTESCVKDTLEEIYSQDRDVIVSYERELMGRKITFTFMDC